MPRKIRAYACEDCGRWTVRARLSNEPRICAECGKDRIWHRTTPKRVPPSFTATDDGEVLST